MSYHTLTVSPCKAEIGLDQHEDSLDEEEYEQYATFHRECRAEPKQMPYVKITEEGGKSVYQLRHELNNLLKWRDANQKIVTSLGSKDILNLVISRIKVIKALIY